LSRRNATEVFTPEDSDNRKGSHRNDKDICQVKYWEIERNLDEVNYVTVSKTWLSDQSINEITDYPGKKYAGHHRPGL
jgi:hypothetical protein